jgi:hypothetical protein
MNLTSTDPRMARMASSGIGITGMEIWVKDDVHKNTMHMRMKEADARAAQQLAINGRGVAVGKYIRCAPVPPCTTPLASQSSTMPLREPSVAGMMDVMLAQSAIKNAAGGPIAWAVAGMDAGVAAATYAGTAKLLKKAHDMMSWQCQVLDPSVVQNAKAAPDLSDLKALGDDTLNGVAVTKYEFYACANGK